MTFRGLQRTSWKKAVKGGWADPGPQQGASSQGPVLQAEEKNPTGPQGQRRK